MSQSFAMSFNDFYDTKEIFIQNLASLMNISSSRIFVAKIVAVSCLGLSTQPPAVTARLPDRR